MSPCRACCAVRRDAWTLHPNDVVGRVWVVLKKPALPAAVAANDATVLNVFTTICPHLGCSVNQNADATTGFTCPCHSAQYNLDGSRKAPATNPRRAAWTRWNGASSPTRRTPNAACWW